MRYFRVLEAARFELLTGTKEGHTLGGKNIRRKTRCRAQANFTNNRRFSRLKVRFSFTRKTTLAFLIFLPKFSHYITLELWLNSYGPNSRLIYGFSALMFQSTKLQAVAHFFSAHSRTFSADVGANFSFFEPKLTFRDPKLIEFAALQLFFLFS